MIPVISIDQPHPYPPRITEFTQKFWNALSEGRFITTASVDSGQLTFPPKPVSPHAWDEEVEWVELSGRGKLYAHTTVHASPTAFVGDLPYRICIVDLDEGIRLATRLIGDDTATIDGPIELVAIRYTDCMSYAARAASA
jgi:uncharacterized protein